jgi:hypothetical protein
MRRGELCRSEGSLNDEGGVVGRYGTPKKSSLVTNAVRL